jgi:hypothetical protein
VPGQPLEDTLRICMVSMIDPLKQGEIVRQCIQLHMREMLEPTSRWAEELDREIKGPHRAIAELLCRHLGVERADDDIHRLTFAITGLSMQLYVSQDFIEAIRPSLLRTPRAIDTWADRLTGYALALVGAEAARRRTEEKAEEMRRSRLKLVATLLLPLSLGLAGCSLMRPPAQVEAPFPKAAVERAAAARRLARLAGRLVAPARRPAAGRADRRRRGREPERGKCRGARGRGALHARAGRRRAAAEPGRHGCRPAAGPRASPAVRQRPEAAGSGSGSRPVPVPPAASCRPARPSPRCRRACSPNGRSTCSAACAPTATRPKPGRTAPTPSGTTPAWRWRPKRPTPTLPSAPARSSCACPSPMRARAPKPRA